MQINCYSKKHGNLDNSELKKIIQLKKQEWKYNSTSHNNWIKVHLKRNDVHFILKDNKEIIGYTLLRNIFLKNKYKRRKIFYFDTHILDKNYRNKYYKNEKCSHFLMNFILNFLKKKKILSVLRCKQKLIRYYKIHGWKKIGKKYVDFDDKKKLQTMFISGKKKILTKSIIHLN